MTRYDAPLSWDEPHDIVYRVKLHKRYGQLAVWIDGKQVVDLRGEGVGHSAADHYWTFGLYYSAWSELAGPVVAEYANHVYPSLEDLMERVASPMEWPTKGVINADAPMGGS